MVMQNVLRCFSSVFEKKAEVDREKLRAFFLLSQTVPISDFAGNTVEKVTDSLVNRGKSSAAGASLGGAATGAVAGALSHSAGSHLLNMADNAAYQKWKYPIIGLGALAGVIKGLAKHEEEHGSKRRNL